MNREAFIANLWKPYPDAHSIGSELQCFRINHHDQLATASGEIVEDEKLGPSCPSEFLTINDWVAWCEERKVYFLLSPSLGDRPATKERNPRLWSQYLNDVRQFFLNEKFDEIQTPYLVRSPGVDHHIDFFQVKASKSEREWTLPTSPEIHLKKHLCQGFENIFEIKNCFRDDLPGENHTAEFTMLEWYRSFAPLDSIAEDLNNLIQFLKPGTEKIKSMTVSQLFAEKLEVNLTPATTVNELKKWADQFEIDFARDDDWNDLFFRIFMEKIEPGLGANGPILLWYYPAQQASLAKISKDGWAQRFELYWKGVELANAYLEVNDPSENRLRFEEEAQKRLQSGVSRSPMDENFFHWMEFGMPPASGIALGLDRLFKIVNSST